MAKEHETIRQHEDQIHRLKEEVRAKILARFQLKADQIVADPETQRSEALKTSALEDRSLSMIEPNQ